MKKFNFYYLFFIVGLIIIALGLSSYPDKRATLDINIHDTYFVFHFALLTSIISIIFYLLPGILYHIFYIKKIKLNKWLTNLHYLFSIGSFVIYMLAMFLLNDDTELEPGIYNDKSILNYILFIILIIFILGQILFIINLLISSIKYSLQSKNHKS